ncbi:hypothetical protein GCM10020219_069240 [Nonomuraea dietziae]
MTGRRRTLSTQTPAGSPTSSTVSVASELSRPHLSRARVQRGDREQGERHMGQLRAELAAERGDVQPPEVRVHAWKDAVAAS